MELMTLRLNISIVQATDIADLTHFQTDRDFLPHIQSHTGQKFSLYKFEKVYFTHKRQTIGCGIVIPPSLLFIHKNKIRQPQFKMLRNALFASTNQQALSLIPFTWSKNILVRKILNLSNIGGSYQAVQSLMRNPKCYQQAR